MQRGPLTLTRARGAEIGLEGYNQDYRGILGLPPPLPHTHTDALFSITAIPRLHLHLQRQRETSSVMVLMYNTRVQVHASRQDAPRRVKTAKMIPQERQGKGSPMGHSPSYDSPLGPLRLMRGSEVVCGGKCSGMWRYVAVCGGMWWYMVVCGGIHARFMPTTAETVLSCVVPVSLVSLPCRPVSLPCRPVS